MRFLRRMFLSRPRKPLPLFVLCVLVFVVSFFIYSKVNLLLKQTVPAFETNFKIPFTDSQWLDEGNGTVDTGKTPRLAWILHFNYEPHPEVVKILLHFYSKHFVFIAIVCPTGRIGPLVDLDMSVVDAEVVWSPPCPIYLRQAVAGLMMRCYATGLELLQSSSKFKQVDYVVLSNDDVVLNMTKVKEFASGGRPVSHYSPSKDPPPIFEPPVEGVTYFGGWYYAEWWAECQQLFSKVPLEYKARFLKRFGDKAFKGGVDIFLLPVKSVPEFILLSSIVGECWIEMNIPNALAMLTEPIRFYSSEPHLLIYNWKDTGTVVTPKEFEEMISGRSILSFHPFKLSYPEHRAAFIRFMTKYKFN